MIWIGIAIGISVAFLVMIAGMAAIAFSVGKQTEMNF